MALWDEAKDAADEAKAIATDPAAREQIVQQAEEKAREYADDPAKAIADAQNAASEIEAKVEQAKQEAAAYAGLIPDAASAVEKAREDVAAAQKQYQEAYNQYGPEAAAKKALDTVKQELVAVQAKAEQLKDLAAQGVTGAQAMAEAIAGEIEGLMSVAVAACSLAGGAPKPPPQPSAPAATVAKLAEMREAAVASKAEIDAIADELAAKYGGAVAKAPIKSEERALEKIMADYDGDAARIKDLARNTIIVPEDQIEAVTAELIERGAKAKIVDAANDPLGYSGVNTTLKTANGLMAEIQVNTPQMIYAKEKEAVARAMLGDEAYDALKASSGVAGGQGHALYEEYRSLDPKDPASAGKAAALEQSSKAYYETVRGK